MSDRSDFSANVLALHAGVAVQAADPEVHGEVREHYSGVTEDEDPGRTLSSPLLEATRVQVARVDQPRDERRRLLRVPAPVASPGRVRPPGAERDAKREHREADEDGPVRDLLERRAGGKTRETTLAVLHQVQHRGAER